MALNPIKDPDLLQYGVSVDIDTTNKKIILNKAGNLNDNGVTLQALYSFLKELWPTNATLRKLTFPLKAITDDQYFLVKGWDFTDNNTRMLIRSAGWAVNPSGNTIVEEWACIETFGDIADTDQLYYITDPAGPATDFLQVGSINHPIKIYGDAAHGNVDIRNYFKVFLRSWGYTYDSADLASIGVTRMEPKLYTFVLKTEKDDWITLQESELVGAPYNGMSITFYDATAPYVKTLGGVDYTFNVVIDANGGNKYQVYQWVQSQLRKDADIDAGPGTHIGKITDVMLDPVIDKLVTLLTVYGGVLIENFDHAQINDFAFTDNSGNVIRYPYVAVLTINFNENLTNDASAYFVVFFKNDDDGDNLGRDFGTVDAIVVNDNSGNPMEGWVAGRTKVQFEYDYDNNDQRGAASKGKDAPIVAVAIGRELGKYITNEATIYRTTTNEVSLYAETEYWYANP